MLDRAAFDAFAELFEAAELREVIADWHADALAVLAQIAGSLDGGEAAEIGRLAHRAAGGSLALGAFELAALWEQTRGAAESAGSGVSAADLDRLRGAVELTRLALSAAAAAQ